MRALSLVISCTLLASVALAKESAVDRTKALILAFKSVKPAPDGQTLSPADQKANADTFKQLDGFFNFARLTGDALEPHRAKLSPEQHQKAAKMFEELIRLVSYPKAGSFLRDADYKLKPGKSANDIEMQASLPKEDFQTNVVFHWEDSSGALRLVDVSFDGASLIKDYKNQFGRIIEKDGPDGLLKKLSTRLDKERKTQQGV